MGLKPSDFFLGVIDFFSVILPGAILAAFLGQTDAARLILATMIPLSDAATTWAAFAASAYFLGHIAFLAGSLLDECAYDRWREWRHPKAGDLLFQRAVRHRNEALALRDSDPAPINAFQWARTLALQGSPSAAAEIKRHEADAKFFRSMVFVLPVLALCLHEKGAGVTLGALLLAIACFFRYADRRWKSTEVAYQHLLVMASGAGEGLAVDDSRRGAATQEPGHSAKETLQRS